MEYKETMMSNKYLPFYLALLMALLAGCGSSNNNSESNTTFQYRPDLQTFDQCEDLKTYLLDTAEKQRQLYDWGLGDDYAGDVTPPGFSGPVLFDTSEDESEIDDLTGTNNQVAGVDEADFVKTTGDYTYLLTGDSFLILKTWPAAESQEVSRTQLEGYPRALFVDGEIAWILSEVSALETVGFAPRIETTLKISLFNVSDPTQPELIRETQIESYYSAARMVDHRVYLVVSAYLDLYPYLDDPQSIDVNSLLPTMTDNTHPSQTSEATTQLISECNAIYRPGTANGTGTVSLLSFDLQTPTSEITRESLLSNNGLVYANRENLYLATMEDEVWMWLPMAEADEYPLPGTNIHKFRLSATPEYVASGRVDGWLLNQFAMDEYQGVLRVVTTEDKWWEESSPENRLYELEQSGDTLVERSRLEGLGKPGERIYSARFMQDKGFLVTFEQIDPFYTLDLSDPDQPMMAGELEVPGYSTYLHPIEGDMILAMGRNTDDNVLTVSLFDVADFSNPQLLSRQSIGVGSNSEAEYNHHAFTWFEAENMLAIPATYWNDQGLVGPITNADIFSGLELFRVTREDGIQPFATVDHDIFYQDEENQNWYYPEGIRRSFFVSGDQDNNYLYSISSRGFLVNDLAAIETNLAEIPLPSLANDYFYFE
jgi:uncharacterized secreted protein with C-terminal beta-propeller domain